MDDFYYYNNPITNNYYAKIAYSDASFVAVRYVGQESYRITIRGEKSILDSLHWKNSGINMFNWEIKESPDGLHYMSFITTTNHYQKDVEQVVSHMKTLIGSQIGYINTFSYWKERVDALAQGVIPDSECKQKVTILCPYCTNSFFL